MNWKLSPSDFAFLWDECRRCYYLKIVRGFNRPFSPFPKIFNVIDGQMRAFYGGRRTESVLPVMPPGRFATEERWVESATITVPGRKSTCYIKGKIDAVVAFDDATHGLVDFKTSSVKGEYLSKYGRQLHAYVYALEHAANPSAFSLSPITSMGLLVFEPQKISTATELTMDDIMKLTPMGLGMTGPTSWTPIEKDQAGFMQFIDEMLGILDAEGPPPAGMTCEWCKYRAKSRENLL